MTFVSQSKTEAEEPSTILRLIVWNNRWEWVSNERETERERNRCMNKHWVALVVSEFCLAWPVALYKIRRSNVSSGPLLNKGPRSKTARDTEKNWLLSEKSYRFQAVIHYPIYVVSSESHSSPISSKLIGDHWRKLSPRSPISLGIRHPLSHVGEIFSVPWSSMISIPIQARWNSELTINQMQKLQNIRTCG